MASQHAHYRESWVEGPVITTNTQGEALDNHELHPSSEEDEDTNTILVPATATQGEVPGNQESHLPREEDEDVNTISVPPTDIQDEIPGNQESHPLSEEDEDANIISALSTDQPLSLKESLGFRGAFGVIGGSLWILGIFGFLTFLWFGHGSAPEAADATSLWRFIALHNYFPQTVTICSVALRFAVSAQAAICTSMIAALMLEKHGAQKRHVAWFSIMRSLNDGPLMLGGLLLSKRRCGTFLKIETWLTFLLIVVTLALQFSSTLLLSDLDRFVVVGDLNSTEFGDLATYKNGHILTGENFNSKPPVYAVFGEVQESFDATPNSNGVSDTGLIQRSLLPIPGVDARVSVREIEGNTMVMSSQSSCIRPRIKDPKYYTDSYNNQQAYTYGYIVGTLDYDETFENAGVTPNSLCTATGCEPVGFACVIPSSTENDTEWRTVTCIFDGVVGGDGPASLDPIWDPAEGLWSRNTTIALAITTNIGYQYWYHVPSNITLPPGKPYQEWQSYDTGSGHFNITLCSFGFSLGRFHTSMIAHGPLHEPQTQWDRTSNFHNTTDVQNFMGVNIPQGSHSDRNILDLKILGAANDPPEASQIVKGDILGNLSIGQLVPAWRETMIYLQLAPGFDANSSIQLCISCSGTGYEVNPETSLVFGDTVAETGRAANALLTLMTTLFASVYYTYLDTLDIPHNASLVATTVVETPKQCSTNGCLGYVAVSTLILLHVICVVTIVILYVAQARFSRYGNVWHTIAQLGGDGLSDVLKEADDANDALVERGLKTRDENQTLKVGRQSATGRVQVISSEKCG
ncbi:hypothetical protein F5Y12DRAFT_800683 [Xylaria sp. FL1777]|nr:hypothetical protein F5Y12DRAFT_800683 [Xylaria sp. FL1777]